MSAKSRPAPARLALHSIVSDGNVYDAPISVAATPRIDSGNESSHPPTKVAKTHEQLNPAPLLGALAAFFRTLRRGQGGGDDDDCNQGARASESASRGKDQAANEDSGFGTEESSQEDATSRRSLSTASSAYTKPGKLRDAAFASRDLEGLSSGSSAGERDAACVKGVNHDADADAVNGNTPLSTPAESYIHAHEPSSAWTDTSYTPLGGNPFGSPAKTPQTPASPTSLASPLSPATPASLMRSRGYLSNTSDRNSSRQQSPSSARSSPSGMTDSAPLTPCSAAYKSSIDDASSLSGIGTGTQRVGGA